jgi:hypothetical protein
MLCRDVEGRMRPRLIAVRNRLMQVKWMTIA